jgi:hypothetical protein
VARANGLADPLTPSEVVPYKARVDVILVGSAYAPTDEAVDALVARLCIGRLDKSIGVIGDRVWVSGPYGLEPGAPKPFRSLPLAAELAPRTAENPGGFNIARPPEKGALALPNLEAVDDEALDIQHAAFGPLSAAAWSRRSRVTAEGSEWIQNYASRPMPEGFDYAFFNVAPQDQQIDELGAEATLVLENLLSTHPRIETRLPSMHPTAFVVASEGASADLVPLACDTVWIDTAREKMTLTWRGFVAVPTEDAERLSTLVVVASSKDRAPRAQDIELLVRAIDVDERAQRAQGVADDGSPRSALTSPSASATGSSPQTVIDDVSTLEVDPSTVPDGSVTSAARNPSTEQSRSTEGGARGTGLAEVADDPSTLVKGVQARGAQR